MFEISHKLELKYILTHLFQGIVHSCFIKNQANFRETSLMVQGLKLCASNVGDVGWVPDGRTKISCVLTHGQKKKFF